MWRKATFARQTCFSSEDEVEIPVFHDKGDFISSPTMASTCNLGEEIISDDEKIGHGIPGSEKQGGECTWSAVTKEAEALVHLIENARSSSLHAVTANVNRPCKGKVLEAKPKPKPNPNPNPNFCFAFRSHKADIPLSQELETVDNRTTENSMVELLENFQGEKMEQSEIFDMPAEVATGHELPEHSMAELLDNYQEKTGLPLENSKMYTRMKGRSEQPIDERNISPPGERNMDKEDPPEALDSGSSSDDEVSPCVDEARCIDVEILSRCLEAKLTVCCCSLSRDKEVIYVDIKYMFSDENTQNIALTTTTYGKQVQVGGKDEAIILSAYFSQISS
ncbi:hypothetical protein HYC85_024776 [Camellia sinensis]|uniref:Uncharacterized protein n=1 Tax=Camellia sinensis TaxID=4442 RepID=A0A7J7G930_CAMSI|nr:hypothetical protein HYC85_024776 [Camellia sinensis]